MPALILLVSWCVLTLALTWPTVVKAQVSVQYHPIANSYLDVSDDDYWIAQGMPEVDPEDKSIVLSGVTGNASVSYGSSSAAATWSVTDNSITANISFSGPAYSIQLGGPAVSFQNLSATDTVLVDYTMSVGFSGDTTSTNGNINAQGAYVGFIDAYPPGLGNISDTAVGQIELLPGEYNSSGGFGVDAQLGGSGFGSAYASVNWQTTSVKPDATVLLNFDDPAPFVPVQVDVGGATVDGEKNVALVLEVGSGTPVGQSYDETARNAIATELRHVFKNAGVNINFTTDPNAEVHVDEIIYFSSDSPTITDPKTGSFSALRGATFLDRHNRDEGVAMVYVPNLSGIDEVAITAAHELGHTFGLVHQNKDDHDTGIMYKPAQDDRTKFHNYKYNGSELPDFDQPTIASHNHVAHLLKWVAHKPLPDHVEEGTWEKSGAEYSKGKLKFNPSGAHDASMMLYDVTILGGPDAFEFDVEPEGLVDLGQLGYFSSLSIGDLFDLEVDVPIVGSEFMIFGSSTPGGPVDIFLEAMDGAHMLTAGLSLTEVTLQRYFIPGTSIEIASATFVTEPEIQGDFNDDGLVHLADYTAWRDTLGATVDRFSGADGSGNGVVDLADYDLWKSNFGASLSSFVGASEVPEPSSIGLLGSCFMSIATVAFARNFGVTRLQRISQS